MEESRMIRWSEEALEDLDEIWRYIAEDNPDRATSFVNEIMDFAETLKYTPKKGIVIPEFGREEFREVYFKNYEICYEICLNAEEILIHEVVNCYKWYTRTKKREE